MLVEFIGLVEYRMCAQKNISAKCWQKTAPNSLFFCFQQNISDKKLAWEIFKICIIDLKL